VFTTAK